MFDISDLVDFTVSIQLEGQGLDSRIYYPIVKKYLSTNGQKKGNRIDLVQSCLDCQCLQRKSL